MTDAATPREMWEQRYSTETYLFGTEPNDFLRASLPMLPRGDALCLAEGEGRNSVFLAEHGYVVHSVDLTSAGVVKTLRLATERGVTVHPEVGDLAHYDLGARRWDLIVSIFAHMPPEARRNLHRRVITALRSGGAFLLEAYRPEQVGRGTGGPPTTQNTMTLDALREELSGLELVHAAELEREIVEGPGHTGLGAVVQVIARKA